MVHGSVEITASPRQCATKAIDGVAWHLASATGSSRNHPKRHGGKKRKGESQCQGAETLDDHVYRLSRDLTNGRA